MAALCHGPASFLSAGDQNGDWLFRGRKPTAFTNEEEQQVGLDATAPWLLEDRLRAAGANFTIGSAWQPYIVVDGNLITAQNPASAGGIARAIQEKLR